MVSLFGTRGGPWGAEGPAVPVPIPATSFGPLAGDFAVADQPSVLILPTLIPPSQRLQLWTVRNGQLTAGPVRPFTHFRPQFVSDMDKDGELDLVGAGTTPPAIP